MNESSTMMSFAFSGGYLKISLILSRRGLPPLQWRILARQGGAASLLFSRALNKVAAACKDPKAKY